MAPAAAPQAAPAAQEGPPTASETAPAAPGQATQQEQDQGILKVSYPSSRIVFVNGERIGKTNVDLTVPATNLMVDLGSPRDYSPEFRVVSVSPAAPATVSFTPRAH